MKVETDVTEAINATREILQNVVISLDSLSERVDKIESEIERIKDAQNELLGGLALQKRVQKFKEDYLGLELKPSAAEEIDWDSMKAYCSSCTKMVNIVEPTLNLKDKHATVRAKCKTCGAGVFRNLS